MEITNFHIANDASWCSSSECIVFNLYLLLFSPHLQINHIFNSKFKDVFVMELRGRDRSIWIEYVLASSHVHQLCNTVMDGIMMIIFLLHSSQFIHPSTVTAWTFAEAIMKLRATNAILHLLFNCPCFVVGGIYYIEDFNSDRSGVLNCAFSLMNARCSQKLRYK